MPSLFDTLAGTVPGGRAGLASVARLRRVANSPLKVFDRDPLSLRTPYMQREPVHRANGAASKS